MIAEPISEYFGSDEPMIVQVFWKGGWQAVAPRPATWENIHRYIDNGARVIGVSPFDGTSRVADFTSEYLLKEANRPMFGGRVI